MKVVSTYTADFEWDEKKRKAAMDVFNNIKAGPGGVDLPETADEDYLMRLWWLFTDHHEAKLILKDFHFEA